MEMKRKFVSTQSYYSSTTPGSGSFPLQNSGTVLWGDIAIYLSCSLTAITGEKTIDWGFNLSWSCHSHILTEPYRKPGRCSLLTPALWLPQSSDALAAVSQWAMPRPGTLQCSLTKVLGLIPLLAQLILNTVSINGVRSRDPGDNKAVGCDFSDRLWSGNHGRKKSCLSWNSVACNREEREAALGITAFVLTGMHKARTGVKEIRFSWMFPCSAHLSLLWCWLWWNRSGWPLCGRTAGHWSAAPHISHQALGLRWCRSSCGQGWWLPSTAFLSFSARKRTLRQWETPPGCKQGNLVTQPAVWWLFTVIFKHRYDLSGFNAHTKSSQRRREKYAKKQDQWHWVIRFYRGKLKTT